MGKALKQDQTISESVLIEYNGVIEKILKEKKEVLRELKKEIVMLEMILNRNGGRLQ